MKKTELVSLEAVHTHTCSLLVNNKIEDIELKDSDET